MNSRSVIVCFTCVRNIVFEHRINFCVDVMRMVCFPCVFGCALSVYHLSSHWVRVCLLWVYVVIEYVVNSKWFQISTSLTTTKKSWIHASTNLLGRYDIPDSKVHGANMGPTWVLSAPDGPHVGPMNLAIRDGLIWKYYIWPHIGINIGTCYFGTKFWTKFSVNRSSILLKLQDFCLNSWKWLARWPASALPCICNDHHPHTEPWTEWYRR